MMRLALLLLSLFLWSCGPAPNTTALREQAESYCTSQGGEVIDGRLFAQTQDYCLFSDRSACELFDYQRGVCQQGQEPFPF